MNIQNVIEGAGVAVIKPGDVVVLSVDVFLDDEQRALIRAALVAQLPRNEVVILGRGVTIQIWRPESMGEYVTPSNAAAS